ncbi:DUF2218 domain-containing protein [Pseudooceanicola onchidii]|uniref:DUF2218 domain-containing protein n=1 Tax=Pseudooceanicola onchidii TaxID=2562279 RepID=UPI0010AA1ABD|nr:DUF2218 domain-containing protein [Pseudooceanicola onchidii]
MVTASTRFETPNASKYLQSLCKHFAHKVSVSYDAVQGRADLPPGPAVLQADDTGLNIEVSGADVQSLMRAKFIIEDHLLRFAFREEPEALQWSA